MYRRILLCYDGSAEGRNALKQGADVATAMRAETHLLAILRSLEGVTVPEAVSGAFFEQEDAGARRILEEGVDWLRARGLEASGHITFGSPLDTIAHCARALEVDLVVVGHQSRSRLSRWWADSESAALLERAPCSVLVAVSESR